MGTLDPETERRCRDSFARQQAMTAIGASVFSVTASMMVMDTAAGLRD